MSPKIILLVEDNADEERLTLRAFKREKILNEIVVARDGGEALDYLFATGAHQGRSHDRMPQVVLLDLKLPKIDGLGVLTRMRAPSTLETASPLRPLYARVVDGLQSARDRLAPHDSRRPRRAR